MRLGSFRDRGAVRWFETDAPGGPRLRDDLDGATLADIAPLLRAAPARSEPGRLPNTVPPVAPPPGSAAIYAIGLNYAARGDSVGLQAPAAPALFMKPPGTLAASGHVLRAPSDSARLDCEVELAVLIGAPCHAATEAEAQAAIAAWAIANDMTDRSQPVPAALLAAKGADGFLPISPVWTGRRSVGLEDATRLTTRVNGATVQDGRLAQMLLKPAGIIAHLSRFLTLRPGDIVLTGSPPGGIQALDPPAWLQPGDRIEMTIDGLGSLVTLIGPPRDPDPEAMTP